MVDRTQDTYDQLLLMVGEVHANTRHIIASQAEWDKKVEGLSGRITVLERFRWKALGIVTAVPIALTALGMYVQNIGNHSG